MAPVMYVTASHTVLIAAKQVTNGSTIEAGYSIGGVIKKRFTADFCEEITIVNLTCPLKPGKLWNYILAHYYTLKYSKKKILMDCRNP